jgi:hypothetical protein
MLIEGRPGVAVEKKRAFELAAAGAALGCAHSKGALGLCYVRSYGVAKGVARGLALGRESAAAGSCFGQHVVGRCYRNGCGGVAQDYPRLCDSTAFQQHRGMQSLSTTWASCLSTAEVLRRTMPRLCDSTALQRRRGMHLLRSTWATCFSTAEVLRRTMPRLCGSTALQRRRGMQTLRTTWASCLRTAEVLRRTEQRPSDGTASPVRRDKQTPPQRCSDWARDARAAECLFWLTSRLHARRVAKRLPSKSKRSDAGDCFRRVCFLQAAIHVGGAEAKRLCVLAWRWKGGALHGGARERSAACALACPQLN